MMQNMEFVNFYLNYFLQSVVSFKELFLIMQIYAKIFMTWFD